LNDVAVPVTAARIKRGLLRLWLLLVLLWTVPVGWLVIYAAMQDAPKAGLSVAYCPQVVTAVMALRGW
jgi:hypothetical protein